MDRVLLKFYYHTNCLASFPGPAQLSVACSTDFSFARGESLGTRLQTVRVLARQLGLILEAYLISTIYGLAALSVGTQNDPHFRVSSS